MLIVDRSQRQHYGNEKGRLWGVGQLLKRMEDVYADIPVTKLLEAQRRGLYVHRLFGFYLYSRVGLCPAPTPRPGYEGYYGAIEAWGDRYKPEPLLVETPALWPGKNVAGTPDGKITCIQERAWATEETRRVITIPEVKTTAQKLRIHEVQVQLYGKLEGYQDATRLRLLYLHADGTYEWLQVLPTPADEAAALHALASLNAELALETWRQGGR